MLITENVFSQKKNIPEVKWANIAQLQNTNGTPSLGFAGAINGFYNHTLIVAGGANFPDKMPWEQGKKHFSKAINSLKKIGEKWEWDTVCKTELPEPIAYCGNTVTPMGIVYAGGENEIGLSNKTYLLKWSEEKNCLEIKQLPNLPIAVSNISLTSVGNVVYAAGGDQKTTSSNQFLYLNLWSKSPVWKQLPNLPIALANAAVIANDNFIYVIGGRSKTNNGISDLHNSTFAFDLKSNSWRKMASISDGKYVTNLSAAAAVALGKDHILTLGGDNGVVFHQIEVYLNQINLAKTEAEKERLTAAKNELVIHHKGFYKGILLYSILTNTWTKIGELPFLAPVTTTATKYNNDIILSNGEIKPGIRTPNVMLGKVKNFKF
ncbi:MAG: kelch repeat-containing protein [Bacteroidota bacterium]